MVKYSMRQIWYPRSVIQSSWIYEILVKLLCRRDTDSFRNSRYQLRRKCSRFSPPLIFSSSASSWPTSHTFLFLPYWYMRECSSHRMNNVFLMSARLASSKHNRSVEHVLRYFDTGRISKSCRRFTRYPHMHRRCSRHDYLIVFILMGYRNSVTMHQPYVLSA